ncbi:biliverdin-producing heme oxygenase [Kaistella sp.]|uniref:biliverdin-producing heme oxygenase n=1 Tax=Kaistella sp. TaxID=2782235 RepID=UPI002F9213B0
MISETLKANTKILHDRVEAHFNSQRIFDGRFSVVDYRNLIRYNYLFLLRFEDAVFSAITPKNAQQLNLEKRRKLASIKKDMEVLNIEESATLTPVEIRNEAEAFGILYVMEGSTLGGNVIAKQLSKHPDFQDLSFSYFRCYGENTGSFWKNFKQILDQEITVERHQDCISGAEKAYQFLLSLSV